MGSFDSPIGQKKFAGSPLKEIDIPDDSGYNYPSHQEPVVRRRPMPDVNVDAIRDFQAHIQRQEMPVYDQDPAEIEREIRQAREDRKIGRERLSEGAKKRIEMLLGMTTIFRDVDIMGNIFVLKALQGKEIRKAIVAASEYDGTVESPFEIRKQLLARSLFKIAGIDADQFIGSGTLDAKLMFVEELDDALLNRLYSEYLILAQEAKEKYAIKSEEEVKEVIDDLKK
jgi:hypothetical protein